MVYVAICSIRVFLYQKIHISVLYSKMLEEIFHLLKVFACILPAANDNNLQIKQNWKHRYFIRKKKWRIWLVIIDEIINKMQLVGHNHAKGKSLGKTQNYSAWVSTKSVLNELDGETKILD